MRGSTRPPSAQLVNPLERQTRFANVRSWSLHLQRPDIDSLIHSPADLIVLDQDVGARGTPIERQQIITQLRHGPDGAKRIVLARVSLGEARTGQANWQSHWTDAAGALAITNARPMTANDSELGHLISRFVAPASFRPVRMPTVHAPQWLGAENALRRGNFAVRYWMADWQARIFGSPAASIDRIIATGFDGVYLDSTNAHDTWASEHHSARSDMIALVRRVTEYSRARRSGFLIVMQDDGGLYDAPELRGAVDAVASVKRSGSEQDGSLSKEASLVAEARGEQLAAARRHGLPILVMERVTDASQRRAARRRLEAQGFIPGITPVPDPSPEQPKQMSDAG